MDDQENNKRNDTPPFLRNHSDSEASNAASSPVYQRTFGDYWAIIKRRWWIGVLIGILVSSFYLYRASQIEPLYRARATIIFEQETDRVLNIQEVVNTSLRGLVDTILRNHHTMLTSNTFRAQVIESLSPDERELIIAPYRYSQEDSQPSIHAIIANANQIHRGGDNVFHIEFHHRSGEAAALLANRFVDEYNQHMMDRKREGNTSAMRFLRARAEELRLRVEQGELALQEYRKNKDLVSLEENQNLVVKRLQSLDSSLTEARIRLLELETTMNQIEEARQSGNDILELPAIAQYGSIPELLNRRSGLRTERRTLETRYGERHPRMIHNAEALEAVNKELEISKNLALRQLESNLERQRQEVAQFKDALSRAEEEAMELDRVAIEYNVLRRKLEADRSLFDQINSRLNETTVASQLSITNLRVVDRAGPPAQPFMPNNKTILTKSFMLFGLCFLGIPFIIDYFDKKVRSFKDIEFHLHRLHLGNIPKIDRKLIQSNEPFLEKSNKLNTEWFRSIFGQSEIYSSISYPKSILITSSIPQEGKSFFLSHFAYHLSRHNKKVLVVDTDFRNPRQARNFGINTSTGLNEWVRNQDVTRPPIPTSAHNSPPIHRVCRRLYLAPAGSRDENPTEILTSGVFLNMVDRLKKDYDVILFDSPPAGVFPDASLITKVSDEIIYLVKYKAINRVEMKHIIRDLEQSKARLLGIILNFSRGDSAGKGKYYQKYKKYYSDSGDTKSPSQEEPKKPEKKTGKTKPEYSATR